MYRWRATWIQSIYSKHIAGSGHIGINSFRYARKLFAAWHRLYMQDHSRGRGLTTTGQPTVSPLSHFCLLRIYWGFHRFSIFRPTSKCLILVDIGGC